MNVSFPKPTKCYSDQVLATWQRRRDRGDTLVDIGKSYNLSARTIWGHTVKPRKVVTDAMAADGQTRRDAGESASSIGRADGYTDETVRVWTTPPVVPEGAVPLSRVAKVTDFTKQFPITVGGVFVGYFKPKGDDNEL